MRQRVERKNLQSGVQSRTRETAWGAFLSRTTLRRKHPTRWGCCGYAFQREGTKFKPSCHWCHIAGTHGAFISEDEWESTYKNTNIALFETKRCIKNSSCRN